MREGWAQTSGAITAGIVLSFGEGGGGGEGAKAKRNNIATLYKSNGVAVFYVK